MEREQIIKALECCVHIRVGQYCGSCPYNHMLGCRVIMNNDAIALISELTEENERLRAEVAREIFAELEQYGICEQLYMGGCCLTEQEFEELKKKYGVE